jgi:hypothetical protein
LNDFLGQGQQFFKEIEAVQQSLFRFLLEFFQALAQSDKLRVVLVLAQPGDEFDFDLLGFLAGSLASSSPSSTSASITRVSRSSRTVSRCTFSWAKSMVFAPSVCLSSLPWPLGGFTES